MLLLYRRFYRQKRSQTGKYHVRPQAMWPISADSLELSFSGKENTQGKRSSGIKHCFHTVDSSRYFQHLHVYLVESKSEGISVAWFSAHVSNMHTDKDRNFQTEYEVSTTLLTL